MNAIMTVGAYRPLDDCLRIAFTELVAWIHQDYGLSELDAYELLSKVARIHLNEMVDPNYVVVASIEKRFLPQRRGEFVISDFRLNDCQVRDLSNQQLRI